MLELLKFLQAAQAADDQANLSQIVNQHATLINAQSQAILTLQRNSMILSAVCFGLGVAVLILIAMNSRLRWRLNRIEAPAVPAVASSR
jgi:hypothetical protein